MKKMGFIFDGITEPINLREYHVARALQARGWDILWLNLNPGRCDIAHSFKSVSLNKVPGNRYLALLKSAWLFKRNGVTAVWIEGWRNRYHNYILFEVGVMRMLGFKVVYDPIDPVFEYQSASDLVEATRAEKLRRRMNLIYRLCHLVLVVTPELRDLMIKNGAPADRLSVARFGTNAEIGIPSATTQVAAPHPVRFTLGWLGSMTRFKGIEEVFIPALKRLHQYTHDIDVLIAGHGPLLPAFEKLKLVLGDRLHILGTLDYRDMPAFLGQLQLYVIPLNDQDAFSCSVLPVKLFDALLAGIPVVITDTPTTRKFACAYPSIYLAQNQPDSFVAQILKIQSNYADAVAAARQSMPGAQQLTQACIARTIAEQVIRRC